MKKELLFDYNVLRDWPKPTESAIKRTRFHGFVFVAFFLINLVPIFHECLVIEKRSDYFILAHIISMTIYGIIAFFFPEKVLIPFRKESKHNYIKIDHEKIVWRQGFFQRRKTVNLSEVERYEFKGVMIYVHTVDRKLLLNAAEIKVLTKKDQLFKLIEELAKREF